jgi:hypothetical protein
MDERVSDALRHEVRQEDFGIRADAEGVGGAIFRAGLCLRHGDANVVGRIAFVQVPIVKI